MKNFANLKGSPLLPSIVENYWGKITPDHIRLAHRIARGTEGLGPFIQQGSKAYTYASPFDACEVVKITHEYDDAYATWLEGYVLPNQDNPHVPQISFYMKLNNGQCVVVMERLIEFDDMLDSHEVCQQKEQLLTIAEELSSGHIEHVLEMDISDGMQGILSFLSTFDQDYMDVAEPNAMFRPDGTLVITDPMV